MPGKPWTDDEKEAVRLLTLQGMNTTQVVDRLREQGVQRTYKAVEHLRTRNKWRAEVQVARFELDPPVVLRADRALLLFDVHAPLHDAVWMNRIIALALKWDVKACAIGGDIVEYSSISYWGRIHGIEFDHELEAACMIVRAIEANFANKVLIGGNHEWRFVKALKKARTLQHVLKDFTSEGSRTVTSIRKWFFLESGGVRFRVCHPANYNRIPARNAQALASKYKAHVIAGHNHLWGMTRDVSDSWYAVDAGCCLDKRRVAWLETEMSNYPQPVQGAVIVVDGTPILLGKQNIAFYEGLKL